MDVVVVGAGIAGVGAARAAHRAGHRVRVLERAPALRTGGYAIVLWPNGAAVLGDLGVDTSVVGHRLSALDAHDARGRALVEVDTARLERRLGGPTVCVRRSELIAHLAEGLPQEAFVFGARVSGIEQDAGGVRVHTENGQSLTADLVVGADGVNSRVRTAVFGEGAAQAAPTGVATWQGLVRLPLELGSRSRMFMGRQGMVGLHPAGDGVVQWLIDLPWDRERSERDPVRALAGLRERYSGWAEPVRTLLSILGPQDVEVFPHRRHPAPLCWNRGRVALVGDAAHAMSPVMALGAGQALEDVGALTEVLAADPGGDGDPGAALERYGRGRERRAVRAATIAQGAMATSDPPGAMRWLPSGASTWMFERLLRGVSNRL
ncbi:FAD-dependent monooxygenase [Nocardiopsis sp. HNM0947]|uniref:FAD-dependent monooxygenase n=1 Tax=Nocardiopsis coralli TaxID=2772213 RepID=A0ABR9P6T9_9ACTN|nr:NAD(P)/FAD-dependent oxidoreductase [Nocardiopsis coralli]MBE2999560.1 FAD-dependent monooxygenase [Nocardiopsis coralli]